MPTDDEWAEADMLGDDIAGHHVPRSPEQGVKDMQRRLTALNTRLEAVRSRGDDQLEPRLIQQIRDAQALLAQYQALLNRN